MYAAGGGTDTVIRTLVGEMAKSTGWAVNAINRPGSVGGVATRYVLNKAADGYTWLGAANYNKFVRPMGYTDSAAWIDWQHFAAATSLASWSVRPDSPFKTFNDVIAAAKKKSGKLTISTSGVGSIWHEVGAIVADAAGIELRFVPYKGGKPATVAGLQGEVDIAGGGVHEHVEFLRAGKLRNLMHTGPKDLDIPDYGKAYTIVNYIPALKALTPMGGTYSIAVRRQTPVEVLNKIKPAWIAASKSEAFGKIAKRKYFQSDIRVGADADRRAAQLESLSATTLLKLQKHIGKKVRGPKELGLPAPKDFDAWWPPKGYKPRMS
jgi:tripartite-type tricarboxylate transporter receptor subunit TctC